MDDEAAVEVCEPPELDCCWELPLDADADSPEDEPSMVVWTDGSEDSLAEVVCCCDDVGPLDEACSCAWDVASDAEDRPCDVSSVELLGSIGVVVMKVDGASSEVLESEPGSVVMEVTGTEKLELMALINSMQGRKE